MIKGFAVAAILALISGPCWAEVCNLTDFEANVISCKNACDQSHQQAECNGSGTMSTTSASDDADGIIRGFEVCHADRNGKDKTKDEIAEACLNSNRQDIINIVRRIYNHPKPPPPPPPPPPVKKYEFNNAPMHGAPDDKQVVIADLTFEGTGEYAQITLDFRRNGERVFNLSTYAVNYSKDNGKLLVKITTYDKSVKDVSKFKYTVTGTLAVTVP
ncbi:hypothetical protein [Bradyrhizobium guangdongense]|uniref:hypothetical protein n=1 Tax=Bradyrhizobium guangdongense TaxID=1325090 RepID=UPI00112B630C|nr:hypothetical protein [Bradyrhizobium guangdongense]